MAIGERVLIDGEWSIVGNGWMLTNTHKQSSDCDENGCMLHNPSKEHHVNVESWPYNWRTDRGIMERICSHGVGHPDPDSAKFLRRIGREVENIHGCCGCCSGVSFAG